MKFDIERIKREYAKGKSVPRLARELGISPWSVYKAMRQGKVQRRTPADSNALRFATSPTAFTKKRHLSRAERELSIAGLMIYWAEGSKRGTDTIDLTNSDPVMIQIFLKFLREIYQVSEERMRVLLYCYSNQNVAELIKFWSALTRIPKKQFTKPYVRTDWQLAKVGRMPYGMVHIRYSDQRLLALLKSDIANFTNTLQ